MGLQVLEGAVLQCTFMGRFQDDLRSPSIDQCFLPAWSTQAPVVPVLQSRESVLGHGGRQVVARGPGELEEGFRDPDADRVGTMVIRSGLTAPRAIEAGHWVDGAWNQVAAEDVVISVGGLMARIMRAA